MWCQRVNSAALRRRGSCCLSASLRRHLLMAFPQSSSHLPYISSLFFESLFPLQRLSYIVSSPYISSVSLSCLLGCLYSHRISSFIFSRVSPCISFYRLLALIIIISHLFLASTSHSTPRTRIPPAPFCCSYRPSSLMSRLALVPHL